MCSGMSLKWIQLLILGCCLVPKSLAIRCYVCGETDIDSISCSNFQIGDPGFTKECETGSRSCRLSRKVNENVILSRTCERLRLDDCKTANSIEFCYCTTDLCNKINPSDDEEEEEEFLEGSGTRETDMDTTTEGETSNQDITVSTGKANTDLRDSIEKNTVSSGCSFCQSILYLFGIVSISIYLIM